MNSLTQPTRQQHLRINRRRPATCSRAGDADRAVDDGAEDAGQADRGTEFQFQTEMKLFGGFDTTTLKKHFGKKIMELEDEKRTVHVI